MAEAKSLGKDQPLELRHESVIAFKTFVSNNPNLVEVQGLEGKDGRLLTDDLLQMFFENSRFTRGGKIEKIYVSDVKKAAILTFSDKKVAQGLIDARYMIFHERILTVTLPTPGMCDFKAKGILVRDFAPLKFIQPGGCIQQLKEQLLSWFASIKYRTEKSPGVVDCYIYPEEHEAFVIFEDFIDAVHVMQAKGAEGIVIDGKVIGTLAGPFKILSTIQKRMNMTDRGNYGIEETQKPHPVNPNFAGEHQLAEEKLRKSQYSKVPEKMDVDDQILGFWQEKLPNGTVVDIYTEDITNVQVDVIVNAANGKMNHAGGIAAAIARAAGYSLDKECQEEVRIRGKIEVTQNIVTTGGKLCRKVIHVVGPNASGRKSKVDWKPILVNTFINALETFMQIEMGTLKSIAIPAVSSGVYGVPVPVVAEALKDALCTFDSALAKKDNPKIIHLVNILPETTHQIIQAFKSNDLIKTKSLTGSTDSTVVDARQQTESIGSFPARHRRGQRAQATHVNDNTNNKEVNVQRPPYATNAGSDYGQYSNPRDSQIERSSSDSYGTGTNRWGNSGSSSVGFLDHLKEDTQSIMGNVRPMDSGKSGDNKENDSLSIQRKEFSVLRQFYEDQRDKEVSRDQVSATEQELKDDIFNQLRGGEKFIQEENIVQAENNLELALMKAEKWEKCSAQKSLPETTHQIIQTSRGNHLNKTKSMTGSSDSTGVDSRGQTIIIMLLIIIFYFLYHLLSKRLHQLTSHCFWV